MTDTLYRSVKASERNPQAEGYYHTNIGRIEFKLIGDGVNGDGPNKEPMWLNRSGGHVAEWFEPIPFPGDNQSLEQDFKELNQYFTDLYHHGVNQVKDAGHLWIAFTDKFNAFKKKVLAGAAYGKGGEEKHA